MEVFTVLLHLCLAGDKGSEGFPGQKGARGYPGPKGDSIIGNELTKINDNNDCKLATLETRRNLGRVSFRTTNLTKERVQEL